MRSKHHKITNPFLKMFVCPNCLKRHEMGTKLCSYECLKEYQEKDTLKDSIALNT